MKHNDATYPPPGGAPGGGPYEGAYPGLLNSGPLQIIQATYPETWNELSKLKSDIWTRKKDVRRWESKSTVHAIQRQNNSVPQTSTRYWRLEETNAPLRRRTSLRPTVLVVMMMLLLAWIIIPHCRYLLVVRSNQE